MLQHKIILRGQSGKTEAILMSLIIYAKCRLKMTMNSATIALEWYLKKGIVHTKVGACASQLNPVERTHQISSGMAKTMMSQAVFSESFWVQ